LEKLLSLPALEHYLRIG